MHWLNNDATAVQALAAVGTLVLTCFLVWATLRYVRLTSESLNLARIQVGRDWNPDLRITDVQRVGSGLVHLHIANMAKPVALVKELRIGTGGRAPQNLPPQDILTFRLILLVNGGQIRQDQSIHTELGQYRQRYSPPPSPPSRSPWQSSFSIALVYDCAGAEHQSPWFDFSADFEELAITRIQWPP